MSCLILALNFHLGYEGIIVAFRIIWTLPFSWMVADALRAFQMSLNGL